MQRTRAEFVQTVLPQWQGQSAAPEERALTQIHSTEPLQRENFSSCLRLLHRLHTPPPSPFLCTLFVLPVPLTSSPLLPSGNLYYFIFLRSL